MTPLAPPTLAAPAAPASALTPSGVATPGTPTALTGSTLAAPGTPASALAGGGVSAPSAPGAALAGGSVSAPATPAAFGVAIQVSGFPSQSEANGTSPNGEFTRPGANWVSGEWDFTWVAETSTWFLSHGPTGGDGNFRGTGGDSSGPWTATAWQDFIEDEAVPAAKVTPPPGVVAPSIPSAALSAPGVAAPAAPLLALIPPGIFFAGTLLHKGQALAHLGNFLLHNPV